MTGLKRNACHCPKKELFWACPLAKASFAFGVLTSIFIWVYSTYTGNSSRNYTKDNIMEIMIGQIKLSFSVSKDVTQIGIEIPCKGTLIDLGIRHAPKSIEGQVFSLTVEVTEKKKPSDVG